MDLQRQNNSGCLFPFGDGLLPNLVFFLQLNEHSLEGKQIEDDEDEEEDEEDDDKNDPARLFSQHLVI